MIIARNDEQRNAQSLCAGKTIDIGAGERRCKALEAVRNVRKNPAIFSANVPILEKAER